jgi:hypothetical protein
MNSNIKLNGFLVQFFKYDTGELFLVLVIGG